MHHDPARELRLGIVTPVVTRLPAAHARWEVDAGPEELAAVVAAADRLGYDFCTCSEHVAVPVGDAATRGGVYWDPASTLAWLAARTTRIRLATFVVVLAYHHPLALAKRYGTLDRLSGGRLVLGVGVGTLEGEFRLLGAPFEDRGPRADDAIRALRAAFGTARPRYRGSHYTVEGVVTEPTSVQARVPIWVGGRTGRSLRRAVRLGDGWAPFGLGTADLGALLRRAAGTDDWAGRRVPLQVVTQNRRPWDPLGEPDRVAEALARHREIGATHVAVRLVHHSPAHYGEQLEALAGLGRDRGLLA